MRANPADLGHHLRLLLTVVVGDVGTREVALRTAAARLAEEFRGIYGTETIERFLNSSYDQLADRAAITKFLPLTAERFGRQRLKALAKVEGLHNDGKPDVLFLCTHNAGRSQMALGFFEAIAGDRAVAWSGGSEPGQRGQSVRHPSDGGTLHRHLR